MCQNRSGRRCGKDAKRGFPEGGEKSFLIRRERESFLKRGQEKVWGRTLLFASCLEDNRGQHCPGDRESCQEMIDPSIQILTVQEHRRKNQAENAGHISQPVGLFVHSWRILFGVEDKEMLKNCHGNPFDKFLMEPFCQETLGAVIQK